MGGNGSGRESSIGSRRLVENTPSLDVRDFPGLKDGGYLGTLQGQVIGVHLMPQPFGGVRPYFVCPGCGDHFVRLYLRANTYRCRRCLGLSYASQKERDGILALYEARRCRRRVNPRVSSDLSRPFPPRPRYMHHATYEELRRRDDLCLRRFLGLLDRQRERVDRLAADLERSKTRKQRKQKREEV